MHEKGVLQPIPNENVHMMRSEPHEGDPSLNMVLRSSVTTGGDVRKQPGEDGKGHNAPTREPNLEIEKVKGMSKEA